MWISIHMCVDKCWLIHMIYIRIFFVHSHLFEMWINCVFIRDLSTGLSTENLPLILFFLANSKWAQALFL